MFLFLKSKLRSKKWLNASLLLGIILLIAVVSCHPMFLYGSLNKLLDSAFLQRIANNNEFPAVISIEGGYNIPEEDKINTLDGKLQASREKWMKYLDVEIVEEQRKYKLSASTTEGSFGSHNNYLDITYMEDMEKYIQVVKGVKLSEAKTPEGIYPCLISVACMDKYDLTCGEVVSFTQKKDDKGNSIQLQIVGIFQEADTGDIYWYQRSSEFLKEAFVDKEAIESLMSFKCFEGVSFGSYAMLDYTKINGHNVDDIKYYLDEIQKKDERVSVNFSEILVTYQKDAKTVATLLWVLELPMFMLLLAFIYMVSGQILKMETAEIAMMKSRGVSRGEVIKLYIEQSGALSIVGVVIGLPFGLLLCKLAASTNSFLVFDIKDTSAYSMTWQALPYALLGIVVAVIFMTLPVISCSKLSIVQQKSMDKKQGGTMFWEKYFLDVLLVVISVYLLFNYNQQKEGIAMNVLMDKPLDPVIFINASLFMMACGLFLLRLIHYLVKLIYYIGRNKWSPAIYASFLQITRTFSRQGFISIFLVMTLAMGIFNSNMVRTINENKSQRITYDIGADVVFQEYWRLRLIYKERGEAPDWLWQEPDYERFVDMKGQGLLENLTRVLTDNQAKAIIGNIKSETNCRLMGINTKEFGETAVLMDGLNDRHWYYALNALAETSNGVIISSNLAKKYELQVGDVISLAHSSPVDEEEYLSNIGCTIVAIVNAWPGYNAYTYTYPEEEQPLADEKDEKSSNQKGMDNETKNQAMATLDFEDGVELKQEDRYLLVCNYAFLISSYGQLPYEIWLRLAEGKSPAEVENYLENREINIAWFNSVQGSMEDMLNSPVIQITNGMYTLSFLVAIVLCLAGFLIYWIISIRQRELMFGIYRAMGMNMKEINKMLINEQIFSSLLAVIGGTGVGVIATALFVKLVSVVYLPEAHNIAVRVYSNIWDMVRLFTVILLMFAICLGVLRRLLKNMKIAQALKLGED